MKVVDEEVWHVDRIAGSAASCKSTGIHWRALLSGSFEDGFAENCTCIDCRCVQGQAVASTSASCILSM